MAMTDTMTPFRWGSGGRKLTPEQVEREREIPRTNNGAVSRSAER